jgi:hypothetical protein
MSRVAAAMQWDAHTSLQVGRLGMRGRQVLFEYMPGSPRSPASNRTAGSRPRPRSTTASG